MPCVSKASSVQMSPIYLDATHAFRCPPDTSNTPICSNTPNFLKWHVTSHPICSHMFNTPLYIPDASLSISPPPYVQTPLIFFIGMQLGGSELTPHMFGGILTPSYVWMPHAFGHPLMSPDSPNIPICSNTPCMSPVLPCASPICYFKTTTPSQSRKCSKSVLPKTSTPSQSRNCSKSVLS